MLNFYRSIGKSSPILNSFVTSSLSAGAGHIAGGTTYGLINGQNFPDAFQNSVYGVWQSMLIGGVIGVGTTTATCLAMGTNPLNGKTLSFQERKMLNDPLLIEREPITLQEQFAIEEAFNAPGKLIIQSSDIRNPMWQGWNKMQYIHHSMDGSMINVHYYQNIETGIKSGFKIKY